jgi:chromosome segregation ATPase
MFGQDGSSELRDHEGLEARGATEEPSTPWPNLRGDLDEMLGSAPSFRGSVRGYDRAQVDNYVAWAESELFATRRHAEHLLDRYARCASEVHRLRREAAEAPERTGDALRLAADEAAQLTAAAAVDAERIRAEARAEAEARLEKVARIREAARAGVDELEGRARAERAEAAAVLQRARAQAAALLADAATERDRLEAEAARAAARAEAASARLAAVQEEVDDLRRQRDGAQDSLRRLTARIGEALQSVAVTAADDGVVIVERSSPLASSAS